MTVRRIDQPIRFIGLFADVRPDLDPRFAGSTIFLSDTEGTEIFDGENWGPFSSSVSGGGRTLGPETNTFGDDTTADKAAAAALRDAYATANADWLAQ